MKKGQKLKVNCNESQRAGRTMLGYTLIKMGCCNQLLPFNNYLFAAENMHVAENRFERDDTIEIGQMIFKEAGLAVINRGNRVCYLNFKKGGIFKLLDRTGKLIYEDSGYFIKHKIDNIFPNSSSTYEVDFKKSDNMITFHISSNFSAISSPRFGPIKFLLFRSFMLSLGRFPLLGRAIKKV